MTSWEGAELVEVVMVVVVEASTSSVAGLEVVPRGEEEEEVEGEEGFLVPLIPHVKCPIH